MSETAYHEPDSVDAALALLGADEGARCLAGGQTLVAMLNANLVEPSALVSLRRIRDLDGIAWQGDGSVRIGAMATHAAVARDARLRQSMPLIAETAAAIAHPAIRNMGTIGGAICHADPAADYPPALLAAGASIEIAGQSGRRSVPAAEFFVDYFTTAVGAGEIVTAIHVPAPPKGSTGHYLKYSRVDGDYATVAIAGVLALSGGVCSHAAIAVGACGPIAIRRAEADAALVGSRLDDAAVTKASGVLLAACDPVDDVRGSADYRRRLVPRLVERAVATMRSRLEGRK
jgi:carbon-monoxide dehydrogenase medium subunit